MLDIGPEKLMMLLTIGLIVLGPNKLPSAARGLAHGLARARRMAADLTEPITTTVVEPLKASLAEPLGGNLADPRPAIDRAVAELRSTIANHPLPGTPGPAPDVAPAVAPAAALAPPPADPALN